jgi:hypothetical protein
MIHAAEVQKFCISTTSHKALLLSTATNDSMTEMSIAKIWLEQTSYVILCILAKESPGLNEDMFTDKTSKAHESKFDCEFAGMPNSYIDAR